jgi:mono/diheme cytochrome c family protein
MSLAVVVAATVQQTFGLVIAWIAILGAITYFFTNVRKARPEVGAETELAPNRKPYYDDEGLEGPRLDRFLTYALVLLGVTAVALPLYWLAEPGRQDDSIKRFEAIFASRGEELFNTNCSSCHGQGATGGVAAYVLQDKNGSFLANVTWNAPALNNALLRFDRDEVQYVLDHGRAFSPMQPWSSVGGGAMDAQQIKNLIDYLQSVVITSDEAHDEVADGLEAMKAKYPSASEGELLFNMQAASGSYSCARCHTQGWSYGRPGPTGSGAFGPKLYSVIDKFNDVKQLQDFLSEGCEVGKLYGRQSQCKSGMMPAFGEMYTEEQLKAVAEYVATLDGSQQFNPNATAPGGSNQ